MSSRGSPRGRPAETAGAQPSVARPVVRAKIVVSARHLARLGEDGGLRHPPHRRGRVSCGSGGGAHGTREGVRGARAV